MRKFNRDNCLRWWTISTSDPCGVCGGESKYVMTFGTRNVLICDECRRRWIKGEINI